MINRLIDMNINIIEEPIIAHKGNFTIKEYVLAFLSGLSKTQKERFKKMLEHNYLSGLNIAKSYGVDYDKFMQELKTQLNIKEVK